MRFLNYGNDLSLKRRLARKKTPQATKNITQFLRRIKKVIDANSFLVFFSR
jgi:hypothetical protein